ncbi:hypothetical protein [Streptomyces sp. NPDC053048]|uniref:hypothetical protein n=1 Tax=Streptomyces sp. NPDC053048 TaxID=3365694 RepID=UPI0037CE1A8E
MSFGQGGPHEPSGDSEPITPPWGPPPPPAPSTPAQQAPQAPQSPAPQGPQGPQPPHAPQAPQLPAAPAAGPGAPLDPRSGWAQAQPQAPAHPAPQQPQQPHPPAQPQAQQPPAHPRTEQIPALQPGIPSGPTGGPAAGPVGGPLGGPSAGPPAGPLDVPATGPTPDWNQLADTTAARGRRRKLLMVGGGALAAGAVAAIVATAVVMTDKGGKDKPAEAKSPGASATAEPTFSPVAPPNPREFIASADKDKAPLTTKTLFPHSRPNLDKRTYKRVDTATTTDCDSAAQNGLGQVLKDNGCRKVLRATYVRDGVAVTVGVAVFDNKAAADKAKAKSTGNIEALTGGDAPSFCRNTACRLTANAEGRYAYFTVAGYTNGDAVPSDDTKALQAGRDVAGYTFRRIMARANAQATASGKPSAKPSAKESAKESAKPSAKPSASASTKDSKDSKD